MPFFTSEWFWSVHCHAPLNIWTGVIGQDGYMETARHEAGRSVYFGAFSLLIRL